MNKKIISALFLLMSSSFALSYNLIPEDKITYDAYNKFILQIMANTTINDLEIEFLGGILQDKTIDFGDVVGYASKEVEIFIPSSEKYKTTYLPIRATYKLNGINIEEYNTIALSLKEPILEITQISNAKNNELNTVKLSITNKGEKINDIYINCLNCIGTTKKYFSELNNFETKDFYVKVIPNCNNGIYPLKFIITYRLGYRIKIENYSAILFCGEANKGLEVYTDKNDELDEGINNLTIYIKNNRNIAVNNLGIVISAINAEISGKTTLFVPTLDKNSTIKIPLKLKTTGKDQIDLTVKLMNEGKEIIYRFSYILKKEPKLEIYLADAPKIDKEGVKITIGVANVGNADVDNLVIHVGNTGSYIGSLAAGDYDTSSFTINNEKLNVKITYTYLGKKYEQTKEFIVELPKIEKSNKMIYIIFLLIIGIAIWWFKK